MKNSNFVVYFDILVDTSYRSSKLRYTAHKSFTNMQIEDAIKQLKEEYKNFNIEITNIIHEERLGAING